MLPGIYCITFYYIHVLQVKMYAHQMKSRLTQFCETLLLSKSNIAMQSPLPHTLPAPSNPPAHFISHSFISFSHSIHPFYSCTCFLLLFCSNTSILLFLYSETNVLVLVSIDMTLQNMKFLFILKWHFK